MKCDNFYIITFSNFYIITFSNFYILLIVSLDIGDLLVKLLHLLFFEHAFVLDRHYLDEILDVAVPVVEHATCEG